MKRKAGKRLKSHPKLTPEMEAQFRKEAKQLSTPKEKQSASLEVRELRLRRTLDVLLKRLNDLKVQNGKSLADLSALTGMSRPAISRFLDGQNSNPKLDTIVRLSAALGEDVKLTTSKK